FEVQPMSAGKPPVNIEEEQDDFDPASAERDLTLLLKALTEALGVLSAGGDRATALRESFSLARKGLRAQKALLLYVRGLAPLDLEILYASGLTFDQQEACREMRSSRGVSPSVVREAVEERRTVFIPNSQTQDGKLR